MNTEKWYPVRHYEGRYEVSNTGKVRTLLGEDAPKELKLVLRNNKNTVTLSGNGYKIGSKEMRPTVNIKRRLYEVGYLVALAFKRDTHLNEKWVKHINGNLSDNRVENLQWCDTTGK